MPDLDRRATASRAPSAARILRRPGVADRVYLLRPTCHIVSVLGPEVQSVAALVKRRLVFGSETVSRHRQSISSCSPPAARSEEDGACFGRRWHYSIDEENQFTAGGLKWTKRTWHFDGT